ncbi:hypothetical protein FB45DRAFT_1138011 [Roridomyces roridus]|uniref:Uncharacterized protein n=1 Tax=Roridomyces roridus TaxID=1738132 RepID=A0AAD7C2V4_9AGAR|nr:hypothetical protein FB45DRAFT_1138011 [Roridomyces roridus]
MRTDLALELKLHIADHLPKSALSSLCATSRMHHVQLMPGLYSCIDMTHDQDGTERGLKLIETLHLPHNRRSANLTHPATLIRELKLYFWFPESRNYSVCRCLGLRNMPATDNHRFVFFTDTVVSLLRKRPDFGCLQEILICPFDLYPSMRQTKFQFLEIPGLKSLVYKEPIHHGNWDDSLVESFLRSLCLVPSIISAINALHFPCLEAARIRLFLNALDDGQEADFRPFLATHASLRDVSIPLGRTALPRDALPLLEVFAGHTHDFLKTCDGTRPLQQVAISLYDEDYAEGNNDVANPIANTDAILAALLLHAPSLSHLALVNRPIHYNPTFLHALVENDDEFSFFGLPLSQVQLIAQRAPRLTHLELHIMTAGDLIGLTTLIGLEYLKIHLRLALPGARGDEILFQDLEGVRDALNRLLVPVLLRLREVVVGVIGLSDPHEDESEPGDRVAYNMGHVFRIVPPTGADREAVMVGIVTYTRSLLS